MASRELRVYQEEALAAVQSAWSSGVSRPAIVLACGLGKTVIFAELAFRMVRYGNMRPLVLVHRDELVRQTVAKLEDASPVLRIGVIQGKRMGVGGDVVVASVQTLVRRLDRIDLNRFNVIITDEAHHSPATSYQKIYDHFGAKKPGSGCLSLGVTATLARTDRVGLGGDWEQVVFERDIRFGIENSFLCPVTARTIVVPNLHIEDVHTRHGDLPDGELGKAMASSDAAHLIADAYMDHGRDADGELRRGVMFAPTVSVAEAFAAEFNSAGIPTEVITGETPTADRQMIYGRVRDGVTKVLSSVMVLTEGFDLPAVEIAVVARPTKSTPLYIQMVGRVMRPSPDTGKTSCMILDVVGIAGKHKLVSVKDLSLPDHCACKKLCDCTDEKPKTCSCGSGTRCEDWCLCKPIPEPRIGCPCEEGCYCPDMDCDECGNGTNCFGDCSCHTGAIAPPPPPPSIEIVEIDAFTGGRIVRDAETGAVIRREPPPTPARRFSDASIKPRTPWLVSKSGRPFLPSTSSFPYTIFLMADPDGTWRVGKRPKSARAELLGAGLTFDDARLLALSNYPGMPAKLYGSASPKQIETLGRFAINGSGMTKQQASDALAVAFVGSWL